jgi:carbonic anhydrase/acetyltransferase-like protein (isoleucine patch superfamily)
MLIPYLDFTPSIAAPMDCAATAAIVGRTVAGPGLVLRSYATLRADGEWVRVGANAYFGERATAHIADSTFPAVIGNDVTVGRFALVHACTVEDRVVVGDAAIVMDDAHVGAGALITAGSLVPPRKRLAGGWIYEGNPATPVREIGAAELAAAAVAIRRRTVSALVTATDLPPLDMGDYAAPGETDTAARDSGRRAPRIAQAYIAPTAVLAGDVTVADDASVYFGCAVVAGDGRIVIGPRTNVQDNSLLVTDASRGPLLVGADVTIGHNVRLGAATIGDHALIGMGSQVGDGVVVEEGGCIGARALVAPGTVVKAGWIWVGRPAFAFRAIKPHEREAFAEAAQIYVGYGAAYRRGRLVAPSLSGR